MAGSYEHVVTDKGKLRNPQQISEMLEKPSDTYDAVEEMYGMIWYLATELSVKDPYLNPDDWVKQAKHNYGPAIEFHSPGRQKVTKKLK